MSNNSGAGSGNQSTIVDDAVVDTDSTKAAKELELELKLADECMNRINKVSEQVKVESTPTQCENTSSNNNAQQRRPPLSPQPPVPLPLVATNGADQSRRMDDHGGANRNDYAIPRADSARAPDELALNVIVETKEATTAASQAAKIVAADWVRDERVAKSCEDVKLEIATANEDKTTKLSPARLGGEQEEEDPCIEAEDWRCNCSGRRRSSLAGLIELFEQHLQVDEAIANCCPDCLRQRQRSSCGRRHRHRDTTCCHKRIKVNRLRSCDSKSMRGIITSVKYDHSEEESDSGGGDEDDEIEPNDSIDGNEQVDSTTKSPLERIAQKGVRVLPTNVKPPNHPTPEKSKPIKKATLTALHWQPPTDGRQYEWRKSATRHSAAGDETAMKGLSSATWAATRGLSIVKHQASSSRRLLNQLARTRQLSEPAYRVKRPEKVAQVESLIGQLERITNELDDDEHLLERAERRDWPQQYHERFASKEQPKLQHQRTVRHSESVVDFGHRTDIEPVEAEAIARSHMSANRLGNLISQDASLGLNSATTNKPVVDSASLPRRRPAPFADLYADDLAVRRLSGASPTVPNRLSETGGHPELPAVSYLLCSNAYTPTIMNSLSLKENSRKLEGPNEMATQTLDQMDNTRALTDDLHYRNIRSKVKPEAPEPPFGVPRRQFVATATTTANPPYNSEVQKLSEICDCTGCRALQNRRGRPKSRTDSRVSFVGDYDHHTTHSPINASGFASADSGLHESPVMMSSGRQSAASHNRMGYDRTSALQYYYCDPGEGSGDDDDLGKEVDLDPELARQVDSALATENQTACDSPALERHRAEILATPSRRRPRIKIENPRSKSPLLRVSTSAGKSPARREETSGEARKSAVLIQCYEDTRGVRRGGSISELACHYDFSDDDDDYGDRSVDPETTANVIGGDTEVADRRMQSRKVSAEGVAQTKPKYIDEADGTPPLISGPIEPSSTERAPNYRGASPGELDYTKRTQPKRTTPLFSIGEYKPLNKPDLKIL